MPERPPSHELACDEWQTALAGWVVAQLAPEEEDALIAHMAGCAGCRAEADSLLHVAATGLGADADSLVTVAASGLGADAVEDPGEPPPPDLGDRIAARIARERRARRLARLGVATGVAMGGAAAAVAVAVVMTRDPGEPALHGRSIAFAREAPGVDASAVVAADGEGSVVQLDATGLDPEITYSLWLTPPGGGYEDRIPAGTFRPDGDGEVDARLSCSLPPEDMGRAWATTPDGSIALDTQED